MKWMLNLKNILTQLKVWFIMEKKPVFFFSSSWRRNCDKQIYPVDGDRMTLKEMSQQVGGSEGEVIPGKILGRKLDEWQQTKKNPVQEKIIWFSFLGLQPFAFPIEVFV